jgi:hypothetical protein
MPKLFTVSGIRLIFNLFILFIAITGVAQIAEKTHELISSPEKIHILKLDVPWNHPQDNVAILFDQNILAHNPDIYQRVQINIFTYDLIKRFVYISLLILALVMIKRLIVSINAGTFFKPQNLKIIKYFSLIVGAYIVCGFIFYQLIPVFMPVELMVETVNFSTFNESAAYNILAAIDFKMLLAAIILYAVWASFKEGYQLKQETELTI